MRDLNEEPQRRFYNISHILWDRKDFSIEEWEEAELPDEVTGFDIYGYSDWSEDAWTEEVIDKLSDCYGWCIEHAVVERVA